MSICGGGGPDAKRMEEDGEVQKQIHMRVELMDSMPSVELQMIVVEVEGSLKFIACDGVGGGGPLISLLSL